MKLVIGLTGNMGAGKTVASEYLHKRYGADQLRFSQILMDVLDRLYLPKDRKNLQILGEVIREKFGHDVIVNAFKEDLKKSRAEMVVIDGIRYMNEVDMLRSFKNNILLFINAPPEIRYQRVVGRAEKGEDKITFEEFLEAERRGTEKHLPEVMEASDYVIDNSRKVEDLYKKIDLILSEKLKEKK